MKRTKRSIRTYSAFASDSGVALPLCGCVKLIHHHTSSKLHSGTLIAASRGLVIMKDIDSIKVVSPDRQSAFSGVLAQEVVASVADNEAQVRITSEINGQLDLSNTADVQRVRWEPSERTVLAKSGILGLTSGTFKERRHDRGRV